MLRDQTRPETSDKTIGAPVLLFLQHYGDNRWERLMTKHWTFFIDTLYSIVDTLNSTVRLYSIVNSMYTWYVVLLKIYSVLLNFVFNPFTLY